MNKKCIGCGAILQSDNSEKEGYIAPENRESKQECVRCFRIKNYGDYKMIVKGNKEFTELLESIDKTGDLVLLVVDIFNINAHIEQIKKYLHQNILLILTKRDILPKSVMDYKLLEYMDQYQLPLVDEIVISSVKNYQLDELLEKIRKHQVSKNVYVVGFTNSGKSTLINQILTHYSIHKPQITTSMLPNTTMDKIEIEVDDTLTLMDTPGLLEMGSIFHYVDAKTLKKIMPKKEIRPITYQIHSKQSIFIESLVRIDTDNTNLTFYVSNELKVERVYKETNALENLVKHTLKVYSGNDVVISGLGFICVKKTCEIVLYTLEGVDVFQRKSLI